VIADWLDEAQLLDSGALRFAIYPAATQSRGYARTAADTEFMAWFDDIALPLENMPVVLCSKTKQYDQSLAGLKSCSALSYVLNSRSDGRQSCFIDVDSNVIETQRGNLLFERDGQLYTPSLVRGGVHGVMLQALSAYANRNSQTIAVVDIPIHHIASFDAVWEINALRGASCVAQIDQQYYKKGSIPVDEWATDLFQC